MFFARNLHSDRFRRQKSAKQLHSTCANPRRCCDQLLHLKTSSRIYTLHRLTVKRERKQTMTFAVRRKNCKRRNEAKNREFMAHEHVQSFMSCDKNGKLIVMFPLAFLFLNVYSHNLKCNGRKLNEKQNYKFQQRNGHKAKHGTKTCFLVRQPGRREFTGKCFIKIASLLRILTPGKEWHEYCIHDLNGSALTFWIRGGNWFNVFQDDKFLFPSQETKRNWHGKRCHDYPIFVKAENLFRFACMREKLFLLRLCRKIFESHAGKSFGRFALEIAPIESRELYVSSHWKNHMIFIARRRRETFSSLSVTSLVSTAFHSVISPSYPLQFYTIFTNADEICKERSRRLGRSQFCSVSQSVRSWCVQSQLRK